MTKTKSRIFAALALTTALTAPALIVPMFTAPSALAGEATHDFADLAAKVTPAVVNVSVTLRAEQADADEMQMSDPGQQSQMQEFMHRFAERFGQQGQKQQAKPDKEMQAVGTGFIVDPSGVVVTNFHVAGKATKITVTLATAASSRPSYWAATRRPILRCSRSIPTSRCPSSSSKTPPRCASASR